MTRDKAHKQPDTGARIAAVQNIAGFPQAADPDAVDMPDAVAIAFDLGAKLAERGGGPQHVVAFQQAGYRRFADGHGRQNERAVRNRLVAGHARGADKALRRSRSQGARLQRSHNSCRFLRQSNDAIILLSDAVFIG